MKGSLVEPAGEEAGRLGFGTRRRFLEGASRLLAVIVALTSELLETKQPLLCIADRGTSLLDWPLASVREARSATVTTT